MWPQYKLTLTLVVFTPGGCSKENSNEQQGALEEEQTPADGLSKAEVISEDPHAVLVEFSSVVADTQEYIIKVRVRVCSKLQGNIYRAKSLLLIIYSK